MDIAFEATALLGPRSGVGEFVHGILGQLPSKGTNVSAFAISWRRREGLRDHLPSNVHFIDRPLPARPLHMAWEYSRYPRVEWLIGRYDVVHGSNFVALPTHVGRSVVTVHDLTPMRFPELCQPQVLRYPHLLRKAVSRGSYIHTPSEAVRREVIEYFGVHEDRVRAVAHGIPTDTYEIASKPSSAIASVMSLVNRGEMFVMATGTIEPRKDYPTLLRAFDLVAEEFPFLHLVIAGTRGWGAEAFDDTLGRLRHGSRVTQLGWVTESDRMWLYANAKVFCYPSVYEGFGLPPLEAMAAGIPCVVSDVEAVREVVGDAAVVVRIGDEVALGEAIVSLITNEEYAHSQVVAGRRRASGFTWAESAAKMRAFYQEILR